MLLLFGLVSLRFADELEEVKRLINLLEYLAMFSSIQTCPYPRTKASKNHGIQPNLHRPSVNSAQ